MKVVDYGLDVKNKEMMRMSYVKVKGFKANGEEIGFRAYYDLFKLMTGLDLSDPNMMEVDPSKITVSKAWEKHCVDTIKAWYKDDFDAETRTFFSLTYLSKMPNISETQEDQIKFDEGYVTFIKRGRAKNADK